MCMWVFCLFFWLDCYPVFSLIISVSMPGTWTIHTYRSCMHGNMHFCFSVYYSMHSAIQFEALTDVTVHVISFCPTSVKKTTWSFIEDSLIYSFLNSFLLGCNLCNFCILLAVLFVMIFSLSPVLWLFLLKSLLQWGWWGTGTGCPGMWWKPCPGDIQGQALSNLI